MIELNIQSLRKKALIKFSLKPEGHVFAVRKQTPGDDLAISEVLRKKSKLLLKASELQEQINKLKDSKNQEADIEKADKAIDDIVKELSKLDDQELTIKARVFDDGQDGALGKALYLELSEGERDTVINAVLNNESIKNDGEPTGEK